MQKETKERQEQYRKRVSIPDAVADNVPRAEGADFSGSRKVMAAEMESPPAASGQFAGILFSAVVFVLVGALLIRRFAPDILGIFNVRFDPWALTPATERASTEKNRAEEEAFTKFLTAFQVGPAGQTPAGPVETIDVAGEFFKRSVVLLGTQRTLLQEIGREPAAPLRQKKLTGLCSEMTALKIAAGFPEALPVWQAASALEGLLRHLTEKIGDLTPSVLRTISGGLDLLGELCAPGPQPGLLKDRPLKFLVVDDDLISRQAMSLALKKAFGQPDIAVDGETALMQAGQQAYDVIFLDVELPGMDGFELCTKIRVTDLNRSTPVVFVTGHSDFGARVQSTLTGGNDLMGKPFLIFEITVKALTLALQGRLRKRVPLSLPKSGAVAEKADPVATVTDAPDFFAIAPPPPAMTAVTLENDDFTEEFLSRASVHLGPLKDICQRILQAPEAETRQTLLVDGFLRINSLVTGNGIAVKHSAHQISAALEGMFKKMLEDSKHSTPSMLATAASAVDLLGDLCVPGLPPDLATNPPVQMLVVDDDLVARRVIVGALQTAFDRPESVENGEAALALAQEKTFDVIFLDVVMPGMDGFEVCSKIRDTFMNRDTPVVFVTGQGDFETRAQMTRNGGNDLLAKPFFTAEITVKALTFVLRGRLDRLKAQPKFQNRSLLRSLA